MSLIVLNLYTIVLHVMSKCIHVSILTDNGVRFGYMINDTLIKQYLDKINVRIH